VAAVIVLGDAVYLKRAAQALITHQATGAEGGSCLSPCVRGSSTVKVVPACALDAASMDPPCALVISRAMYKPSPTL